MMKKWFSELFNIKKIENITIIPLMIKVVIIFSFFFILKASVFSFLSFYLQKHIISNHINYALKSETNYIYNMSRLSLESGKIEDSSQLSMDILSEDAKIRLQGDVGSFMLGVSLKSHKILFMTDKVSSKTPAVLEKSIVAQLKKRIANHRPFGYINFTWHKKNYLSYYRYSTLRDCVFLSAIDKQILIDRIRAISLSTTFLIFLFTFSFIIATAIILFHAFEYLNYISFSLISMYHDNKFKKLNTKNISQDEAGIVAFAFNQLLEENLSFTRGHFHTSENNFVDIKSVENSYDFKDLTIFFLDIRNFTSMTEYLDTDIVNFLNLYYSRIINIILSHNGNVASIVGDGLLVSFEETNENKSYKALMTIYDIKEELKKLHEELQMTVKKSNIDKAFYKEELQHLFINIGVGLSGGKSFYGNIGTKDRKAYTLIGDSINLSSRLESLTKVYNVPIICSDYVKDDIKKNVENHDLFFLELDHIIVKGKEKPIRIYWPLKKKNLKQHLKLKIFIFREALNLYYKGDWENALLKFKKSKLKIAQLFITRLTHHEKPKNWVGIWKNQEK